MDLRGLCTHSTFAEVHLFWIVISQGFESTCEKGPLTGSQVSGIRFVLVDGKHHSVDSSDAAFQRAAQGAVRDGKKTVVVVCVCVCVCVCV